MKVQFIILLTVMAVAACARTEPQSGQIADVYVEDFGSDDIKTCRPSDVDLSNQQAKGFFLRARQVEHKAIHDHYNYAPCYIEGTLKQNAQACEWQIRAGATGHIKCNGVVKYYACDACEDLFTPRSREE